MFKYTIVFYAHNDTLSFEIKSQNYELLKSIVFELLLLFSEVSLENKTIKVEPFQQNNDNTFLRINNFVEKYEIEIPPINMVSAFFRKLKKDEYFYFLPNIKLDLKCNLKIYSHLKALNEGLDIEEVQRQTSELYENLLTKYQLSTYGHKRIHIGESDKSKRICRFCNNERKPISYASKAHAISEALGNKTVYLNEECEKCNEYFSNSIEPDLIHYLSVFRTFFDVKGKDGSKKLKGVNFELKNEKNLTLAFNDIKERPEEGMPYNLSLEGKDYVVLQNVYKCLCKYFLSVIDSSYLAGFKETISWINGEKKAGKLPLIGEIISYHSFSKQPRIETYIRIGDDKSIPFAVGVFYFTCKVHIFIIPFAGTLENEFLDQIEFDHFCETFKNIIKNKYWKYIDYSNNEKKKITTKLNIEVKDIMA